MESMSYAPTVGNVRKKTTYTPLEKFLGEWSGFLLSENYFSGKFSDSNDVDFPTVSQIF
jgi:hypothetical protein